MRIRFSRIAAATASAAIAATLLGAPAAHAADPEPTQDALLRACGGDTSGMPSGTGFAWVLKNCHVNIAKITSRPTIWSAVRGPYVDNCKSKADAGIEGSGTYTQSSTWTIGGSISLNWPTFSVSGSTEVSISKENSQTITGTFTVPGGHKAQIIYGQVWDVFEGNYTIEAANLDTFDGGPGVSKTFKFDRIGRAPKHDARGAISAEIRGCNNPFKTPLGDVVFLK